MIDYVRHEAWLSSKTEDGSTQRDYLTASAEKGNAWARRKLLSPSYPEEMEYLAGWAGELVGRSGAGMSGFAPLSPTAVRDWCALTHRHVSAMEWDALIRLDAVLRHPTSPDEKKEQAERTPDRPWPKKKGAR